MVVVRRLARLRSHGLTLRHSQEENSRTPSKAQGWLWQIELLALHSGKEAWVTMKRSVDKKG